MAEQFTLEIPEGKSVWASRKDGTAVVLVVGSPEWVAARQGRSEDVTHKLAIDGHVFTAAQAKKLRVDRFANADEGEVCLHARTPEIGEKIKAAAAERAARLRRARVEALKAELARLEGDPIDPTDEEDEG